MSIWITERECFPSVLMCWIQISNHFCFWLSERSSNIKLYVSLLCEQSFCHWIGWKFVSSVCEHMNCWNRVLSNCFDVLNPNIKSFFILVEWNIIKHNNMCFCYVNHHFVNAVKLVGNLFLVYVSIWITERECFPTVLMCWIQI